MKMNNKEVLYLERIAVIDLGSNSFHMIICEMSEKYFNPIKVDNDNDYKAYVRLGAHLKKGDFIREDKINEILTVLKRFKEVANEHGADQIVCIATEALRRAGNGKEIIQLIKKQVGLSVELISGEKEAYLGYYAIVNSFALDHYLMVDIGGSSTELVYVNNRRLERSISLPIGSLNICDLFDSTGKINDNLFLEMTTYFSKVLDEVKWLKDIHIDAVIGVGGTMRTIGKYERAKQKHPLSIQHNYELTYERVEAIFNDLHMLNEQERLQVKELQKTRATIFPSALVWVLSIMNYVHNKKIRISKFGLREGFIFHSLLKGEISKNVLEHDIEQVLFEQNLSVPLYNHYYSRALLRTERNKSNKFESNLLKISTLFLLKKQESDSKQGKKFLKYLFSRGIFGATHQEMIMALMIAEFPFSDLYQEILTENDRDMVTHIKQQNPFGE